MEQPESTIPINDMIQPKYQCQLMLNSLPENIKNKLNFFNQENNNGSITNKIDIRLYNPQIIVNEGY